MAAADRAINMPLRVTGIGEVERDFKRVGDAGSKSFAQVEKSANGAAREVSEYTARLKRAAEFAKQRMASMPELAKGSAAEIRTNRRDFMTGAINAEKDRIRSGLPDLTRNLGQGAAAADSFGLSLSRMTAFGAAAGTAIYALGNFVVDSVGAFAEHERAIASFNARLELAGNRSNATGAEIRAMAAAVVEATGQTEKAALSAATTLATVPGITKEGLEAALDASSRLADALGDDVSQTAADTAKVLTALADKDMKALWTATEGLNDQLRVNVVRLAETGKTAEAQKVYIEGLAKAAGDGPGGLTKATDQASDAWNKFKLSAGEAFAPAVVVALKTITSALDLFMGKTGEAKSSWLGYLAALSNPITAPAAAGRIVGSMMPGEHRTRAGWINRPEGAAGVGDGKDFGSGVRALLDSTAQAAANAAARAQVKALDDKYGKTAKTPKESTGDRAALGDMVALIKQLFPGARITSTTGGKHTKGSDHYAGRAVDFVPGGGMGQYTTAQVEAMLERAGVDIRRNANGTKQLFGPGRSADKPGDHDDHFHVAFQGSPSPERGAALAERQREEAVRHQRAFEQETAGLDAEILRNKMAQVGDGAEMARLAQQQLKAEAEKYAAGIDAKVKLGELTQAQADELKFKKAIALSLESQSIATAEQARQLQESFADHVAANDNQRELLSAQEAIATTVDERKRLALALLKLDQDEERERLKTVIAAGKLANATEEQVKAAERAQQRLNGLPAVEAAQRTGVERQNRTSLEKFIDDTDPKSTRDKVDGLVYDELMSVRSGVNSAISKAIGTDDPLITGRIEMLLDQVLFRPLAQALQSGMSGGGGGGLGGLLGGIFGAFGGGISGSTVARLTPDVTSNILANPGLFAAGTPSVPTGRDFWVGENGRERMRMHSGGRLEVISGPQSHRAANDGGSLTVVQNNYIPERADPRRTQSGIARANMRSLAEASRKGLAVPGGRR